MVGFRGEDLSKPLELGPARTEVHQWLEPDRDYRIARKGSEWSRVRDGRATQQRFDEILPSFHVGDTLYLQNTRSRRVMVFRPCEVGLTPADTPGTPGIDLIWAFVMAEFDDKYGIVNLGICANKPGQHGKCNAWDPGVSKPGSADAIHMAVRDIARGIRANSNQLGAELPVNGIIVMYEWCERSGGGMTEWFAYHGTPHVSHAHVSAWPSLVPGWI